MSEQLKMVRACTEKLNKDAVHQLVISQLVARPERYNVCAVVV